METIVDTLLKVASSKFNLAQLRAFTEWKHSKTDLRVNYWISVKEKLGKFCSTCEYLRRKKLLKSFFSIKEAKIIAKLKSSFDSDLEEIKAKYQSKLLLMSQEINDLNEKQLILERNSADYIQKEKKYKASIKALEENAEPKELTSSEEYSLLQSENIRLKSKLQHKEGKLIAYFESLSQMVDNAPVNLGK